MTAQHGATEQDMIDGEAAAWLAASAHDGMDWDSFTTWLEADPRHRQAYDELSIVSAMIDDHHAMLRESPFPAVPQNDDGPGEAPVQARKAWRWASIAGGAVAAAFAALLAVPQILAPASTTYRTEASAQLIALNDGSTVMLAPNSTLTIAGEAQDRVALAGGAWFDIRHDPARSLRVTAGAVEITDIGTRFDVQANGEQVRVAVADGEVTVASGRLAAPLRLTQGRQVQIDADRAEVRIDASPIDAIGQWRTGRLTYQGTPLALVAIDLRRYAGVDVELAPVLQERRFSGTLVVGNGEAAVRDVSQLMGLDLHRGVAGYRIDERGR